MVSSLVIHDRPAMGIDSGAFSKRTSPKSAPQNSKFFNSRNDNAFLPTKDRKTFGLCANSEQFRYTEGLCTSLESGTVASKSSFRLVIRSRHSFPNKPRTISEALGFQTEMNDATTMEP